MKTGTKHIFTLYLQRGFTQEPKAGYGPHQNVIQEHDLFSAQQVMRTSFLNLGLSPACEETLWLLTQLTGLGRVSLFYILLGGH